MRLIKNIFYYIFPFQVALKDTVIRTPLVYILFCLNTSVYDVFIVNLYTQVYKKCLI